MRYVRASSFIFCILASITLCSAGKRPSSYHGVQGSYEATSLPSPGALKPLIILDAGHGGSDEGAKINTFMEKKIALTTAFLTKKHLEELATA